MVAAFAATLALGLVLLFAFEPDVQTIEAEDLVRREDDARGFLIADYLFIALYAVLSPIAQRRFGSALGRPGLGRLLRWAPLLMPAAGAVDAVENTLLLSATDSVYERTVDAAHALAVPKVVLFVAAALLSVGVLVRALRTLTR